MPNHRSLLVTWLRNLTTLGVLLACCGFFVVCPEELRYRDGAIAGFEFRLVDPADRRGPRDYFFRLRGQREGGTTIAIAPFFVYPGSFSFEGVGGISDPGLLAQSSDSIACFELFEDGFFGDLAHTVDFCGRYTAGGYQAFNSENQDQRFYPSVYQLEFRVEYDDATAQISYLVRPVGAPTWDLVTTAPFDYTTRLIPSMGAVGLHKGGIYDLEELSWTTTPPAAWTAETGFGWHVQEAYRFDLGALEKLEGAAPDFPGASIDLGQARSHLSLALDLTDDFLDAKVGKQAFRYVVRADKRLEKAQRRATDGNADGAVSNLLKSLRDQGIAFQRTFALDFRDEF
jgi:hypothetical protein